MNITKRATRLVTGVATIGIAVLLLGGHPSTAATTPATDVGVDDQHRPAEGISQGELLFYRPENLAWGSGTVERGDWHVWTFHGVEGQVVDIGTARGDSNTTFNLYAPNGWKLASDMDFLTGHTFPVTGTYVLEVGSTTGVSDYVITAQFRTVAAPPTAPDPGGHLQGNVAIGGVGNGGFGEVGGVVERGDWHEWRFPARAGETAEIAVTSVASNTTLSLYAPNGNLMKAHTMLFAGTLPSTGVYRVLVGPSGHVGGDYILTVSLTGSVAPTPPPGQPGGGRPMGEIRFAPGTSSGSVSGTVERGSWHEYSFRASAGQQLDIGVSPSTSNTTFSVVAPNGRVIAADTTLFFGALPSSGSYKLLVGSTGATASYTVDLSIDATASPAPVDPAPSNPSGHFQGRIQFAAGANSGSASGTVAQGDWHEYSFRADAGQTMNINVSATTGDATLRIYTPSGDWVARDVTSFSGTLPESGLYMIEGGSAGGTASYAINLQII